MFYMTLLHGMDSLIDRRENPSQQHIFYQQERLLFTHQEAET